LIILLHKKKWAFKFGRATHSAEQGQGQVLAKKHLEFEGARTTAPNYLLTLVFIYGHAIIHKKGKPPEESMNIEF
jgi:hypothetical protein